MSPAAGVSAITTRPSTRPPPVVAIRTDLLQSPAPPAPGAKRFAWPSKRMLSQVGLVLTCLVVVLIWFWPVRGAVVGATVGPAAEIVYATGTVEKENRIQIKVKPGGTVTQVLVAEGAVVTQGQVLARLDNPKVVAEAKSARTHVSSAQRRNKNVGSGPSATASMEMDHAQKDYDNVSRLVSSGTLPPQARRDAELRLSHVRAAYNAQNNGDRKASGDETVDELEAVAKAAEDAAADLEIKAPFDGIVLQNLLKVGDFAGPGEPAFGFAKNSEPLASVFVDEASVGRIRARTADTKGSPALITVLALDRQTFPGEVVEVGSEADRTLRTFRVKVRFDQNNPALRSGMSVEANLVSKKHEGALLVPTEAIGSFRDSVGTVGDSVWVVEGLRAHQRAVKVGIRDLELSEIETGLEPGARVIVRPEATLRDGVLVWSR